MLGFFVMDPQKLTLSPCSVLFLWPCYGFWRCFSFTVKKERGGI